MPTADTFSLIRSLHERNQQQKISNITTGDKECAKVLSRCRKTFVSERPEKSREDYERRSAHRYTGFDSVPHIPYKPFAGLKHIDAYALVAETRRICLDQANHEDTYTKTPTKTRNSTHSTNHHTVEVVKDVPPKDRKEASKPKSRTAGLSALQLHLNSTSRAIREVAAGSSLYDTLPREESRKHYLQRMKAPKQCTVSDGSTVTVHNPSIFLPLLAPTASSKTCLVSARPSRRETVLAEESNICHDHEKEEEVPNACQRVGPNIHVAMAAIQFKMTHQNKKKDSISPAKRLQMRSCLIKMKTLYSILCSLYNMKTKDLKEKHPLSLETLKQLSMKPVPRENGGHLHGHRLGGHAYNNSHMPSFHFHPRRNAVAIESWEDLLMLACQKSELDHPKSTSPRRSTHSGHHPPRVIPPWQRQVVFVDYSTKRENNPGEEINKCLQSFQAAKDLVSEQTKTVLSKRKKNSVRAMAVKAECLRLGVDREQCLREMREIAYNISCSERAKERNRPFWYVQLEKEVGMSFKPSLVTGDWQLHAWKTVTKWFLQRLEFFVFSDFENIPRVLEKLCLLVMSLPPDQLCLSPVLESIQFILEALLELPSKLCNIWLEMRGLPANGVPLPTKPVIVLGLTVNA